MRRSMTTVPLVGLLAAAASSLPLHAQTCTVSAQTGAVASGFNAVFTENGPGTGHEPSGSPGWTGGDSTLSVHLPDGDTAFFFSDSYVGQSPARSGDGTVTTNSNGLRQRTVNCNPPTCNPPTNIFHAHNSVVVRNASNGRLTTLMGPVDSNGWSTSYFVPAGAAMTHHWYWMGDSTVVQVNSSGTQKLWTFLMEFEGFTYFGSAIAQLSLPSLSIDSITPLSNVPSGNVVHWGTALWLDGSFGNYFLYIYGVEDNGQNGRFPFVALTNPAQGVAGIANVNNWFVWNGSQWVTGLTNAAQIIGAPGDPNNAGDFVSSEFTVRKIQSAAGTTYLLVAQDTKPSLWRDIVLYSACNAEGPFSAKQVVYSTPEAGSKKVPGMTSSQSLAGTIVTYNPHAHPQFDANGQLLISYDLNATDDADLLFADTYRPKFIFVPISGLK